MRFLDRCARIGPELLFQLQGRWLDRKTPADLPARFRVASICQRLHLQQHRLGEMKKDS
jgi:hypothetical protein